MEHIKHYGSLDELFNYFIMLLPEAKPDAINSISKYAKVNNEPVKLQAKKHKSKSGFSWNFEVTLG